MAQGSSFVVFEPTGMLMKASIGKSVGLDSLKGKRVADIWNRKSGGAITIPVLLDILAERYEVRETKMFTKPGATMPASKELLDEIAGQWDAVITGIGD